MPLLYTIFIWIVQVQRFSGEGNVVRSMVKESIPRRCPFNVCSLSPVVTSQMIILASEEPDMSTSLPCNDMVVTAFVIFRPYYEVHPITAILVSKGSIPNAGAFISLFF